MHTFSQSHQVHPERTIALLTGTKKSEPSAPMLRICQSKSTTTTHKQKRPIHHPQYVIGNAPHQLTVRSTVYCQILTDIL